MKFHNYGDNAYLPYYLVSLIVSHLKCESKVGTFDQEKALVVGVFSFIVKLQSSRRLVSRYIICPEPDLGDGDVELPLDVEVADQQLARHAAHHQQPAAAAQRHCLDREPAAGKLSAFDCIQRLY